MREKLSRAEKWLWGVIPILVIAAIRLYNHYTGGLLSRIWFDDLLLVAGWVMGWFLAEADYWFYALVSNPQEMTSQKVRQELKNRSWKKAWEILSNTKNELTELPIRNVLTAFVITGVGMWVISSSSSMLASGLCLGFSIKLFSEMVVDKNYKSWYWLFAREFTESENRGLLVAWGAVLLWQLSILMRG
jgi:hypothetical protein